MATQVITVSTKRQGKEVEWQANAPKVDSAEEFFILAGSQDLGLEWINSHLATDAGNAGRPVVRDGKAEGDHDEQVKALIPKAQAATAEYAPRGSRGPGKTAKAAALDEIKALRAAGGLDESALDAILAKFGA